MNSDQRRPVFVAFGFDYAASSSWTDLPRLRAGVEELRTSFSPYVDQHLTELDGTAQPTVVMEGLEQLLFCDLGPQDPVIIYLGGHGVRIGDDHFIVGPDANPAALTARNGIGAADLGNVLSQGRPMQIALLLDTCHSGAGVARLAAEVDTVVSRRPGRGVRLCLVSSSRPLEEAGDGVFVETLISTLSETKPSLWSFRDSLIAPGVVARALRDKIGSVESREREDVEPLLPNLTRSPHTGSIEAEADRRARDHFLRAASSLQADESGWFFVGRTGVSAAISRWLGRESTGVFVVTGPPGSGKSAILGRMVVLADPESREEVTSRYPELILETETTPPLHGIDVAVYAREKTIDAVVAELGVGLGLEPRPQGRDELLARASEAPGETTIVLDALDEANGDHVAPITELLRDLGDLPTVKVLVGTRADRAKPKAGTRPSRQGPILRSLEPARVWDLADDHDGAADVASYVVKRLSDDRSGSPYAGRDEAVRAIAGEIADRVEGVFLYARLIIEALLREEALEMASGWESRLPGGEEADLLGAVVAEDLERIPADLRNRVHGMLMALAWAQGEGLPRYRVWPAVASAITSEPHSDQDATAALQHAGWYLVESEEAGQAVYRLYHEELERHFREVTKHQH